MPMDPSYITAKRQVAKAARRDARAQEVASYGRVIRTKAKRRKSSNKAGPEIVPDGGQPGGDPGAGARPAN